MSYTDFRNIRVAFESSQTGDTALIFAAGGCIKLNGRTVSGSQFIAAFERAVYPKKPRA